MKIKLEYIWLDGSEPQQLRSKTKIVDSDDLIKNNTIAIFVITFNFNSTIK